MDLMPKEYVHAQERSLHHQGYHYAILPYTPGVLDVVGVASERPTCLLLPTMQHAVALWNIYRTAISERHGKDWCASTKTAMIMKRTHTHLRLWVPYRLDPTMPMDWWHNRLGYMFLSPWYTPKEVKAIVTS